jgi:hypothetical protein
LRDFGKGAGATSAKPTGLLPSALDVLAGVDRPPDFLDPEAIRPLATSSLHGLSEEALAAMEAAGAAAASRKQAPGKVRTQTCTAPLVEGLTTSTAAGAAMLKSNK